MPVELETTIVTLVAGWGRWTASALSESERRNAIRIVVRLDYAGRSVLLTGDTVGRRLTDGDDACKDAEQIMVERHNAGTVSLKSDVLVASHHGANNGSATYFIGAAGPQFVIFSPGHAYQHPTRAAATRHRSRQNIIDRGVFVELRHNPRHSSTVNISRMTW